MQTLWVDAPFMPPPNMSLTEEIVPRDIGRLHYVHTGGRSLLTISLNQDTTRVYDERILLDY